MDLNIQGKTALITGSTLGIGKALAARLFREGAKVIVTGRSQASVERTVAELRRLDPLRDVGDLRGIAADLGTAEGAQAALRILEDGPKIDILVNNVGYFEFKPFAEVTDDDWLSMWELNVMSGIRLARAILPGMLERNSGRVIFVSSEVALKPYPQMIHYSVTKTAQVSLARGLAELTKGTQVTVNSVIVGPTQTEGVDTFLEKIGASVGKSLEEVKATFFAPELNGTSLLQRFATAEEIADVIAFLASPLSAAINGVAQRADGGLVRTI